MDDDFIALEADIEPTDSIREALNQPTKRKFDQLAFEADEVRKSTPWMANVHWTPQQTAVQQLQHEIDAFTSYIRPSSQEHALRTSVVNDIRKAITMRFRDAQVEPFGSFQTQLYLPSADIDLVVLSPSMTTVSTKNLLFNIAAHLKRTNLVSETLVIWKAKVPIVKCTSMRGHFMIDISINQANGLSVGQLVLQKLNNVGREAASSLIMLVKAFLAERGLNQVYSGGLSSYSVICLVISFLQIHPMLQQKRILAANNTAVLLLEFFEFYGKHFNYDVTGVSIKNNGTYYNKIEKGWSRERQTFLLSVEDPNDASNDIAGGTHNILAVRQSFSGAFDVMAQTIADRHRALAALQLDSSTFAQAAALSESLLGSIVTLNEDVINLRQTNGLMAVDIAAIPSHNSVPAETDSTAPLRTRQPVSDVLHVRAKSAVAAASAETNAPSKAAQQQKGPAKKDSSLRKVKLENDVKVEEGEEPESEVPSRGFVKSKKQRIVKKEEEAADAAPMAGMADAPKSKVAYSSSMLLPDSDEEVKPIVHAQNGADDSKYNVQSPNKKNANKKSRTAFWQRKRAKGEGTLDQPIEIADD